MFILYSENKINCENYKSLYNKTIYLIDKLRYIYITNMYKYITVYLNNNIVQSARDGLCTQNLWGTSSELLKTSTPS